MVVNAFGLVPLGWFVRVGSLVQSPVGIRPSQASCMPSKD